MYELVGVLFGIFAAVIYGLAGTAETAFAFCPAMMEAFVADFALVVGELVADGVSAVGIAAAIEASTGEVRGEFCDGEPEDLSGQDVVYTLLSVQYRSFQAFDEPTCDLTKEDSALAAGVEEAGVRRTEKVLRQEVEHLVGECRRGEDFVVAQIGDAVEDVRNAFFSLHIGIVLCSGQG